MFIKNIEKIYLMAVLIIISLGVKIVFAQDATLLEKYYENKVLETFWVDQIKMKNLTDENSLLIENVENIKSENNQILNQILSSKVELSQPKSQKLNFDLRWRTHHDEMILHQLDEYKLKDGKIQKQLFLSTDTTKNFFLMLSNRVFTWNNKSYNLREDAEQPYLKAKIVCNKPALLHLSRPWPTKIKPNIETSFTWYDRKLNAQKQILELTDASTICDLYFTHKGIEKWHGIRFLSEDQPLALIGSPQLKSEICFLPEALNAGTLEQLMVSGHTLNMTCPQKVDKFETLEDPRESVNAKIKSLIGQDLPKNIFDNPDPFTKLDFNKAPELDAILISYLVFRADFSGTLIMQALKYHAAKGTLIRIAVSDVICLGKDSQMLLDFEATFPNVKLLFYKFNPKHTGIAGHIASLHRSNHIKMFLTYSKSQPEFNQVILGGRNIHDGHIFNQPTSNYIYPTVVQYGPDGDESWANWEDFETKFTSTELVQTLMGQFFATLHADYPSVHARNFTENIQVKSTLDNNYFNLKDNEVIMRTLISIPYKDERNLEKEYIKIIDSAQKTLKLSTPYFNLTKGIFDALTRAMDREVDIELITRLDLTGDTADIILSDVNKKAVNKLYKRIKIFEYTTSGKILHSKLVIVDDKLVIIGSVNLNLRSFHHDLENSMLIYGKGYNKKINDLFEKYKDETRLITEKQQTTFWKIVLINLVGTAL